LFFNNSMLGDAPARDRDIVSKTATFTRALQNVKTLAEGGRCRRRHEAPLAAVDLPRVLRQNQI
jgi:hypothetical protein